MLLGGKVVAFVVVIAVVCGFGIGFLSWNKDKSKCMVSRSYKEGEWHTFAAIGRLEFRVKDYKCPDGFYLDPSIYKSDGFGSITPR